MVSEEKKKKFPFLKKKGEDQKTKTPEITDKVDINFEPSLRDLYVSMDEGFNLLATNPGIVDQKFITEVMSVSGRLRRRQQVRRYKARMQIARKRAMKRRASYNVIKRRARRSAINSYKKRFAGNRAANSLTYSERQRVEKLVARRKGAVARKARRLILRKRQQERLRFSRAGMRRK